MNTKKISILIPVFNEKITIEQVIRSVLACNTKPYKKELIVIDDSSTDGTSEILRKLAKKLGFRLVVHQRNLGKGGAIKTAIGLVSGDVAVIQDADLEYDPNDIGKLLSAYEPKRIPVVYGSRNLGAKHGYFLTHFAGSMITLLFNTLYGTRLSDLHTGYKLFRADLLRSANLETNGFDFCHEVTAKMVKMGVVIAEVPISYHPRKWNEGKKVRAIDALWDILTTIRLRFSRM